MKAKGKGQKAKRKNPVFIVQRSAFIVFFALCLCGAPALRADRVFTSGFETNNFTETEWLSTFNPAIVTSPVHSGTYSSQALRAAAGTTFTRFQLNSAVTSGTFFTRFYFYITTAPSADGSIFDLDGGGGNAFQIQLTTARVLSLVNTADSSSITGPTLSTATWYFIETRHVISDTVGELELRVDATSHGSLTGKDTLPTNVDGWEFGIRTSSTAEYYYDDIAVNSSGGTVQNSWPGEGKIALLKPGSNDTVTWTPTGANCSATTNADCVDDVPGTPDDASGYNNHATANNEDRLNSAALPAEIPSDADMVLLHVFDRWDGGGTAGTRQGRNLLWDEGGAQTLGVTHNRCDVAAGSWSKTNNANDTVFDLEARSKANVEAFDLGYEPLNAAQCKVTAIWANVEWKAAPPAPSCASSIALLGVGCR